MWYFLVAGCGEGAPGAAPLVPSPSGFPLAVKKMEMFLLHWKKRFDGGLLLLYTRGGLILQWEGGKGILAAGGHGNPPAPKIASQPPLPKATQPHKEFHLFHSFLFPLRRNGELSAKSSLF